MIKKKLYGDLIAPVYKEVVNAITTNSIPFITLKGGRFSAKGDTIYTLIAIELLKQEADAFIFAPLQTSIKTGVMEQMKKVLSRIGIVYSINQSLNKIKLTNGSEIHFKGLDANNSNSNNDLKKGIDSSKKYGIRFLVFDELSATKDFKRIDSIIETVIRNDKVQIIEISNPPQNKAHPIFKRYSNQEKDNNYLVLHTTVFDLPLKWINERQIDYIKALKKHNPNEYNHSILGKAVGNLGMAFYVNDNIWVDFKTRNDYLEYYIQTDEATVNATCFCLYGINKNGEFHLIDTFYHSSKDDGQMYSPSDYAKAFLGWYQELGINANLITTDGLPFAMELKKLGFENVKSIGKLKDRSLSYQLLNKLILEDNFKIVKDNSNNIFYQQLTNATLTYNSKDQPMIDKSKESNNDNTTHTHALDTALYFCLTLQKLIMKGDRL